MFQTAPASFSFPLLASRSEGGPRSAVHRFRMNNSSAAPAPNDDAEMFDLAPVSLWLEDYSALKTLFAQWHEEGVADLRAHLAADPARIAQCSACIRVLKVNRKTLSL